MTVGRPLALDDDEARKKLLFAISAGNYRHVAARYAGTSYPTLKRYLARKDDPRAVELKQQIEDAESEVQVTLVGALKKIGQDGDVKAITWFLSHRWPAEWADRSEDLRKAIKMLQEIYDSLPRKPAHPAG